MNILFYGNCQLYAIFRTLNLSKEYNTFHVGCWDTDINEQYFTDIIRKCDIIITQHINDNYRSVDYLSTSHIIKHKNVNSKLIILDSCYFNFYYVDLTYKFFNNDVLHKPIDYHYDKMIECYNNNESIEYYINHVVNNVDLKSSEELDLIAQDSLKELYNRYIKNTEIYKDSNMYIIQTHDYIKENYKNKLLFYSMNHPTKYVIQFICENIIDILQMKNTIDYTIDQLSSPKCILYKCISKCVNFDIANHNPAMLDITDINEITKLYYDTYKEIGFK